MNNSSIGDNSDLVHSTPSFFADRANCRDHLAPEALFAALYFELHRMARRELGRHSGPLTVGPGTLLHQTYINLVERSGPVFSDRCGFLAYAARMMRGLVIDYMRCRRAQKRGGQLHITRLRTDAPHSPAEDQELALIAGALDELTRVDAHLAELVDLKFFCGFSFSEIATLCAVSERTVQRNWRKARIYLRRSIRPHLHAKEAGAC